jgi:hypothetical protein
MQSFFIMTNVGLAIVLTFGTQKGTTVCNVQFSFSQDLSVRLRTFT